MYCTISEKEDEGIMSKFLVFLIFIIYIQISSELVNQFTKFKYKKTDFYGINLYNRY